MMLIGKERATRPANGVVQLGRRVAVIDQEEEPARQLVRPCGDPAVQGAGRSPPAGRDGGRPPQPPGARRGPVWTADRAPPRRSHHGGSRGAPRSRPPCRGSDERGARRGPRWRGSGPRSALRQRRRPGPVAARGRLPAVAPGAPRSGGAQLRSAGSGQRPGDPIPPPRCHRGCSRPAPRCRRRARGSRTDPAGRAAPRAAGPGGRAPSRRWGGPPGPSGSRRRDPAARPPRCSSRTRDRRAPAP